MNKGNLQSSGGSDGTATIRRIALVTPAFSVSLYRNQKNRAMDKQIRNVKELKDELELDHNEFYIKLPGCRSSKHITFGDEDGTFEILNLIDDSTDIIKEYEIWDEEVCNIGTAMRDGCFFCEIDD